jgi:hypothetical protein
VPHAVVSGHVHNYQRFTRVLDGRQIPYIIDGRGGYANDPRLIHKLQSDGNGGPPQKGAQTPSKQDPELDLTIENYDQDNPGFLRATVTRDELTIESFSVPFAGGFTNRPQDAVTVTRDGRLAGGGSGGGGPRRNRGGRRR